MPPMPRLSFTPFLHAILPVAFFEILRHYGLFELNARHMRLRERRR